MYTVDIEDNTIELTRGDTLKVQIDIYKDGEVYTPESGDAVRFALKHNKFTNKDRYGTNEFEDEETLVVKEIPTDTLVLQLDPVDTKGLGFGSYKYDIEITFADGTVDTFIANATFKITPEVH